MLRADEEKIKLLFEHVSGYRISKETGLAQTGIARFMRGSKPIKNATFETASKLTEYAERLMGDELE